VLEHLIEAGPRGTTAIEAWRWYRATYSPTTERYSVAPRLSEMVGDGWAVKTGATRNVRGPGYPPEEVYVLSARGRREKGRHLVTTTEATELRVEMLDPRELVAHPRNVRADLGDLTGLTASIAAQGVLEPLVVVPSGDGHQIVAGHRRAAAAIAAGLDRVPCIVRRDLSPTSTTTDAGRARRRDARGEPAPRRPHRGRGGPRRAGDARPRRAAGLEGREAHRSGPQAGR
jgi:hypothetical protein